VKVEKNRTWENGTYAGAEKYRATADRALSLHEKLAWNAEALSFSKQIDPSKATRRMQRNGKTGQPND